MFPMIVRAEKGLLEKLSIFWEEDDWEDAGAMATPPERGPRLSLWLWSCEWVPGSG